MKAESQFLIGGLCGGLMMLLFADTALNRKESRWQQEAVKHGAAEFYLSPENTAEWRWKADAPLQTPVFTNTVTTDGVRFDRVEVTP